MLTDLQRRKFTRAFQLTDANQDGILERTDFETVGKGLAQAQGLAAGSAQEAEFLARYMGTLDELLQHADTDRDGRITLDEYLGWYDHQVQARETLDRRIETIAAETIRRSDQDGDGQLTVDDYKRTTRRWQLSEREVEAIFQRMDSNGDGYISHEEMLQAVREFYYSDDPDAPGNWLIGPY